MHACMMEVTSADSTHAQHIHEGNLQWLPCSGRRNCFGSCVVNWKTSDGVSADGASATCKAKRISPCSAGPAPAIQSMHSFIDRGQAVTTSMPPGHGTMRKRPVKTRSIIRSQRLSVCLLSTQGEEMGNRNNSALPTLEDAYSRRSMCHLLWRWN